MDRSLGTYHEVMDDAENLREIGRAGHAVWVKSEPTGPLRPSLETICRMAFEELNDSASAEVEARAESMLEDAQMLVGAIREIVAKPSGWQA